MSGVEWGKIQRKLYVADATYSAQRITYHDRTPSSVDLRQTVRQRIRSPGTWAAEPFCPVR